MRNHFDLGKLAAALVVCAVAFGARADSPGIKVMKEDKLGSYLADAKGRTLYTFKMDSTGKSACAGECVRKWPVYFHKKAPADASLAANFGTITRDDGKKQTTYKGLPLYYFAGDKKAGQTKGEGVKDAWYVAAP